MDDNAVFFIMPNNIVLEALLTRRSYKPKYLIDPAPSREALEFAVRAALRAPDHGRLIPYRFVCITEQQRSILSDLFATAAERQGATAERVARIRDKAFKGPALIAFVFIDDPATAIPSYEKMLTAGAALDQFMLALQAQGYGGIILSGSILEDQTLQNAFCNSPNEKLLAWVTVGTPSTDAPALKDENIPVPLCGWSGIDHA